MAQKKPRKICVLGTAGSGLMAPAWKDPTWEVWGCSRMQPYVTRRDRWFETHNFEYLRGPKGDDWVEEWERVTKENDEKIPCPLYMLFPLPWAKDVRPLDPEPIKEKYGTFFLTSTMAWMMAIFLEEVAPDGKAPKGTELALYGIELDFGTEYRDQRAGIRHFMQMAEQFGVKVRCWRGGGLAHNPIPYPYWCEVPMMAKLEWRISQAQHDIENYEKAFEGATERYNIALGRLKEVAEQKSPDADRIEALQKELDQIADTKRSVQRKIDYAKGALNEMKYMQDYQKP